MKLAVHNITGKETSKKIDLSKEICATIRESMEKYFSAFKLCWGPVQPFVQSKTDK